MGARFVLARDLLQERAIFRHPVPGRSAAPRPASASVAFAWMGELIEKLGVGVAYAPYDAVGLARAIDTALQQLPQLQARLREVAPRWRAENQVASLVDSFEELAGFPRSFHAGSP